MAYSRYARKPRRSYRKSVRSGRRSARPSRYTRKTRRYTRRRGMSKRAVLNTTSRKKRDTMLASTNITAALPNGDTIFKNGPAILNGNQTYTMLWCATARDLSNATGGANIIINRAERTASTCYMRGLAENIRIQTTDGLPWTWRRICFTVKSNYTTFENATRKLTLETAPGGTRRAVTPWQTDSNIPAIVFKGVADVDWSDLTTAPLDTQRITVRYDKTCTLAAGNEQGMTRVYKRWHPMNKNLLYGDEENGDGEIAAAYSSQSKAGMGDYYVYDIIVPRLNGGATSQMSFQPEATLYWHEK